MALTDSGKSDVAEREARAAMRSFHALGATSDEARAKALLQDGLRGMSGAARPNILTRRQLEILRLVAQGMSNPEIAKRLRLSDHTVKRHLANRLTKLGLSSRAAAVAYAAKQGLL